MDQVIARGEQLVREGDARAAIETLKPLLSEEPANYWLNLCLARAYADVGDREAATARFRSAISSGYPDPVAALYELVRLDLSHGDVDRVGLLDEALAVPGDLHCRFPADNQKRRYYCQIRFLKALIALGQGDLDEAEENLREAYDFSYVHQEQSFAFDWVVDRLRALQPLTDHPHLEYVRHIFLRLNMAEAIDYDRLLSEIEGPANVVEIGAMDGVRFDPLHRHIVEKRWNAVVVEPLADVFELLRRNYQGCGWVRCANVAISETTGPLHMFRVKREVIEGGAPDWLLGISSAFKRPDLAYLEGAVAEEDVRGLTFGDFAEEFGIQRIDVLQVDTEGYDWRVLRQIDLERWRIGLIHVELYHVPPPDRVKAFEALRRASYTFKYDGMNLTAVLTDGG